jgi:hypothetical protein
MGTYGCFLDKSSWGVKVNTELHLVLRLRMRLYIKGFRFHPVVLVTICVKWEAPSTPLFLNLYETAAW